MNMPRRYKDYDQSLLEIAVELVENKNISSYDAEKQFGIPRRTILNKVKQKHVKMVGCPTKLSPEDEKKIASCLILCGEYGYPLTPLEVRSIVHDYLVKNELSYIFNHKMPGHKWVRNFLKRHNNILTVRSTNNIKESRASKSVQDYTKYFENLKISLHNVNPECIVNYDETNFSDNPGSQKCIFKAGTKHPNKTLNSTKTAISVMFSATASGEIFPPYVVYKADNLWANWCANGPQGTRYNKTKSGWFDASTFEDWFNTIIVPWAQKTTQPKVLIGDNLSSHMNITIITKCQEYNIRFIFLPPNSTHLTQPLDVAFFGPLKREWRKILLDYKVRNPSANTLNKQIFPELLKMLLEASKLTQSRNVINGFRAAGIYPLNPNSVLKRLPDYCGNQINISYEETFVNYLKSLRTPNSHQKRNINKKLFIEPGKSVSANDLLQQKTRKRKASDLTRSNTVNMNNILFNSRRDSSSDEENNGCNMNNILVTAEIHQRQDMDLSNQTHTLASSKIQPGVIVNVDNNLRISNDRSLFRNISNVDVTTPNENITKENLIISNVTIKSPDKISFVNSSSKNQANILKKNRSHSLSSSESSGMYTVHDSSYDGHFLLSNSDPEINEEIDQGSDKENKEGQDTAKENIFCRDTVLEKDDSQIEVGKYVLVKFNTTKSVKYYIGLVIMCNELEHVYTLKFLRKSKDTFCWPVVDDISDITLLDVEKSLPKPLVGRRGKLKFDFKNLNIDLSQIY